MPGQPSKLNSWPWIAAVGYSNPDIPGAVDYLCGGTLVTSRYALVSGGVFLRRQCREIFVFCFFIKQLFLVSVACPETTSNFLEYSWSFFYS
jgi:hypothetical protein